MGAKPAPCPPPAVAFDPSSYTSPGQPPAVQQTAAAEPTPRLFNFSKKPAPVAPAASEAPATAAPPVPAAAAAAPFTACPVQPPAENEPLTEQHKPILTAPVPAAAGAASAAALPPGTLKPPGGLQGRCDLAYLYGAYVAALRMRACCTGVLELAAHSSSTSPNLMYADRPSPSSTSLLLGHTWLPAPLLSPCRRQPAALCPSAAGSRPLLTHLRACPSPAVRTARAAAAPRQGPAWHAQRAQQALRRHSRRRSLSRATARRRGPACRRPAWCSTAACMSQGQPRSS